MPNRWMPITALSLLFIGLMAGIVSISIGEKGPQSIQIEGTPEVQQLIGGIRQLDDRLGVEEAPITIDLFQDVQCPRCADFQAEVVDPLIDEQVRTGEVQMNFRNFPLGLKPVTLGAIGTEAAAEQDRGWQYAEIFMRNLDEVPEQGVSEEYMNAVASVTPKLDTGLWEEALLAGPAEESAEEDVELATELQLRANPILIIAGPGGEVKLDEVPTLDEVYEAIEQVS
jgi:protein-disulfide isomerase